MKGEKQMHVSFREVKEEGYRALRVAGFGWGQAQAGGRIAGTMEAIWGTGIRELINESSSLFKPRKVSVVNRNDVTLMNTHRMSQILGASAAMALAEGDKSIPVVVRGTVFGPQLAAALWDMTFDPSFSTVWGQNVKGKVNAYCLSKRGDLLKVTSDVEIGKLSELKNRGWWLIKSSADFEGEIILSAETRRDLLLAATQRGVAVDDKEWDQLKKKSTAFLVAE